MNVILRQAAVAVASLLAVLAGAWPAAAQTVEYYHLDALGSVRAITDQTGAVLERHDYLPFGEEWNPQPSTDPRMFTGKERDAETGFDYFGARYLSAKTARFTTTDPTFTLADNLVDPQRWNRYVYVRNSALRFLDKDGKWPTESHNEIIVTAFPGLSAHQLAILRQASIEMDNCATCQMRSHNHQHFMKSPGEDPRSARQAALEFIDQQESFAQASQGKATNRASDISDASLREFGRALHTLTDGTSPAHVDGRGDPRDWSGLPVSFGGYATVTQHNAEESSMSPHELQNAVSAAQGAFRQTYGNATAQQAISKPRDP